MIASANGRCSSVRDTATKLTAQKIDWLVYDRRSKDPHRKGWQIEPTPSLSEAREDRNIGIQLRRGLTDVDLDTLEAVRVAPFYLPATGMIFGRDGKPRSHYIYWVPDEEPIAKGDKTSYKDPSPRRDMKVKFLELRDHGQTVAPGSAHEDTGELLRWEPEGDSEPSKATAKDLTHAAYHIAAASLVARYWNDGERHDMALPLAGLLWHGGMPLERAETFMRAVCAGARDDDLDNRLGCLHDTYTNGNAGGPVTGGPTLAMEEYLTDAQVKKLRAWLGLSSQKQSGILGPDGYPLAGDGDGDRFAAMWAGKVLYCAVEDVWYVYDGIRWMRDDVKDIRERAKLVVTEFRRVLGERSTLCGQNGIASYKDCADYSKRMGNAQAITAMLLSAQSKPELRVTPEEFDAHPLMLNVKNCTIDLDITTGRVTSHLHDPADKLTMVAPVNYFPGATHPLIELYQQRFFPEPERWEFLWEMGGYCLTGLPKRHALQLIGPHDSGKTVTLLLFANTLGDGYAGTLKYTSLMKNPHGGGGDQARNDLWSIRRSRLVTISEIPPDAHFDVALLKAMLGGGDRFPVRDLHRGGTPIKWGLTFWMSGNAPYGPPPGEDAAFDRLEVLPCEHVMPGNNRNAAQEAEMVDPNVVGDAVLTLMLEGFTRLNGEKHGALQGPESSRVAKATLRNTLDPYSDVIERLFDITGDPDDGVLKTEAWSFARSEREMLRNSYREQARFEESLQRRGAVLAHNTARFHGDRYWQGVRWSELGRTSYAVTRPDWERRVSELTEQ